MRAEAPRMFAQSNENVLDPNVAQNPLKVRPCFIRLFRDKELDKQIKRSKKNETEVNRHIILSVFFSPNVFSLYEAFWSAAAGYRYRSE